MIVRDPDRAGSGRDPSASSAVGVARWVPSIPRQRTTRVPAEHVGLRADIQGLRAVAVISVVLYHLWPNVVRGGFVGVDVFFVISGFLITGQLLILAPAGVRGLAQFWIRRVRRLYPVALTVIAVVLFYARLMGPDTLWRNLSVQGAASALSVQNWALGREQIDYLNPLGPASPLEHYWSLSVEEQFYLLWPALLLIAAGSAKRFNRRLSSMSLILLPPVIAFSFWRAVRNVLVPSTVFFPTVSRIWELGAGALVAILLSRRAGRDITSSRGQESLRSAVAWIGLVAIVVAATIFNAQMRWPGWPTLVPVLGAALFVAAQTPAKSRLSRVSALRPIRHLGDISYSVYLWHFPMIFFVPSLTGHQLGGFDKAGILLATLLLATFTKRHVEDRFRKSRGTGPAWRLPAFAAAGVAGVVLLSGSMFLDVSTTTREARAQIEAALASPDSCLGAAALERPGVCPDRNSGLLLPPTVSANSDVADAWTNGCLNFSPFSHLVSCSYGPADSPTRIALVGNSHAAQWIPAMQVLAAKNHWRVSTFVAAGCVPTTKPFAFLTARISANCHEWGRQVLEATTHGGFDLVVTADLTDISGAWNEFTRPVDPRDYQSSVQGYQADLRLWRSAGLPVLVLRDTPLPRTTIRSVPDCLSAHRSDFAACGGPRDKWLMPDPLVDAAELAADPAGIGVADLTDEFCDPQRCRAVVGGAMVYFDDSHLSATYARTLAPILGRAIASRLDAHAPAGHAPAAG